MTYDLCVAYVHPGIVTHAFMDSVLRMAGDGRYKLSMVQIESGANLQKARNDCVRWFLANTAATHMLCLDTDMAFGPDVPERLIRNDVPICSALYFGRDARGKAFPVASIWKEDALRYAELEDFDGLTEVAGVGMGCCVIRRDVLEKLGKGNGHPDNWPFGMFERKFRGKLVSLSEDLGFCIRAKDKGFPCYIDGGVVVGHVKSFVISGPALTGHGQPQGRMA